VTSVSNPGSEGWSQAGSWWRFRPVDLVEILLGITTADAAIDVPEHATPRTFIVSIITVRRAVST
jgi:hypothetical protein